MEATKKRSAKLEAKGKTIDFKELLRMEPDSGTTNIRNTKSEHCRSIAAWSGSPPSASSTKPPAATSGSRSTKPAPRLFRRHLDELDFNQKGEGRRDHQ